MATAEAPRDLARRGRGLIRVLEGSNPIIPSYAARRRTERWAPGTSIASLVPGAKPNTHLAARNGHRVAPEDWGEQLLPGDVVLVAPRPGGFLAALGPLEAFIVSVFLSTLTGMIVKALFGPPKLPSKPGDQASPSYGFSGTKTGVGEGLPWPIGFGEFPGGGVLIGSYVSLVGPFIQRLHLLIALCDGEIRSFGDYDQDSEELSAPGTAGTASEFGVDPGKAGIQINGQPASSFGGTVRAWTRRGRLHQAPVPNFPFNVQQFQVGQVLESPSSVAGLPSTPGQYAGGAEPSWVGLPVVSHTETVEAHRFAARLRWEQGQYDLDPGSGALIANPVTVQLRYREVDDLGVPFGDFFVLPAQTVQITHQGAFSVDLEHFFASDYTPPVVGQALSLDGTNDNANKANPNKIPTTPGDQTSFSVLAHCKIDTHTDGNWIFSHFASNRGFRMRLRTQSGPLTSCQLEVEIGNGTTTMTFLSPPVPGSQVLNTWTGVGFSYAGDGPSFSNPNGDGTIELYLGTSLAAQFVVPGAFKALWALSAAAFLVVGETAGGVGHYDGLIDELAVLYRHAGSSEMLGWLTKLDQYGNLIQAMPADESLVGLWHFDGNGNDSSTVGTPNNLTLANGATAGATGIVFTPEQVVATKGKFKVDALRVDAASTGQFAVDETTFDAILLTEDQEFEHPGVALVALEITGSEHLSGSVPNVRTRARLLLVDVWDGISAEFPTFVRQWSANPAWCAAFMATDPKIGMGAQYAKKNLDLPAFLDWANFCDYRLHDGKSEATNNATLSFAAGVVTIRYASPGPPQLKVGAECAIQGTGTDWDTEPGQGMPILTKTESAGNVTLTASWPTAHGWAPAQADPVDPAPLSGEALIAGREERCRCDGYFDEARPGWEQLIEVFQSGRAMPVPLGSVLSVFINREEEPTSFLSMANVVRSSVVAGYEGLAARPNAQRIEFWSRDLNWKRVSIQRDHPSVVDPALFDSLRTQDRQRRLVTRLTQVMRDADMELETYAQSRRTLSLEAEAQTIGILPGDVVSWAHDLTVPQQDVSTWGVSGKAFQASADGFEIYLDRPFTFTAGFSYEVVLRNQITDELFTALVDPSEVPGGGTATKDVGDPVALSDQVPWVPQSGDLYAIGMLEQSTRPFRCAQGDLDLMTKRRKLVLAEYAPTAYELDASFGAGAEAATASALFLAEQERARQELAPLSVVGLAVVESTIRAPGGSVRSGLTVSWQQHGLTAHAAAGAAVWIRRVGEGRWQHEADVAGGQSSYRFDQFPFVLEGSFDVLVQPFGRDGRRLPLGCHSWASVQVRNLTVKPEQLTGVRGGIRGQEGVYSWEVPDETGVRWVEARMSSWTLGQKMLRSEVGRGQSLPSDAWFDNVVNWETAGPPDVLMAGILENGIVGHLAVINLEPSLVGFASPAIAVAVEDDWTDGTLTDLEADPDVSHALHFDGSALVGQFVSQDFVMGAAARVHVSAFYVVSQVRPETIDDLEGLALDSLEIDRWLIEGPALPLRSEGQCTAMIEWSYSDTASPGSTWARFEPGMAYLRSCRFRLTFTRPTDAFDIILERLGVSLRVAT